MSTYNADRPIMRTLALAACLTIGAAVSMWAQSPSTETGARIGDRVVSVQELDDNWRAFDAAAQSKAEEALYDGRKAAFDRLVADALIERAAAAKGVTVETFLADEVTRRRQPVAAADVEAFYNANKQQMQGAGLAAVQDSIRAFLGQRQEGVARVTLVAELRKSGPPVRLTIDPPRMAIEIVSANPMQGLATAPVTVVEYSDYQCPFCSRVTPTLTRLKANYGDRLRIVWKDFPIASIHPKAQKAAEAAHCAGEQGKYWEYHNRIFANQSALDVAQLKEHAVAIGVEPDSFDTCLDSGRHAARVGEGVAEGKALGVNSTPTLFVNGRRVTGAQPYEVFEGIIEDELARAGK